MRLMVGRRRFDESIDDVVRLRSSSLPLLSKRLEFSSVPIDVLNFFIQKVKNI